MKKIICFLFLIFLCFSCKKEPVADFDVSGSQAVGGTLVFNNLSSNATSYLWDFGDHTTSTLSTPTHIFNKPGSYVVVLTVQGNGGSAFTDKTLNIIGTTYTFTNNSSFEMPNFCSFYWDGTELQDFVEHGILSVGHETNVVITHRPEIEAGFIINDVAYIIAETFPITSGQHNSLVINDQNHVYSKKGSSGNGHMELFKECLLKQK